MKQLIEFLQVTVFALSSILECSGTNGKTSLKKLSGSLPATMKVDTSFKSLSSDVIMSLASPLRIIEKSIKHLALDFDNISSDSAFPSKMLFPKIETVYNEASWTVPLYQVGKLMNLMNLRSKMKEVRRYLQKEFLDDSKSFMWVSDAKAIANYVSIVSVSISQLAYLNSRLKNTPNCPFGVYVDISQSIKEHLKVLSEFCFTLLEYSGPTGMTFGKGHMSDPTKYFENLLQLREETALEVTDDMLKIFIDFFFDAFSLEFSAKLIKIFLENSKSYDWIPLPIKFIRNRFILKSPAECSKFINSWKLEVFYAAPFTSDHSKGDSSSSLKGELSECETSPSPAFDSRNLVELGKLMQQGLLSESTFTNLMNRLIRSEQNLHFEFDGNMLKFLTLTASAPIFLPNDPETAMLMGNFALPHLEFDCAALSESEKMEKIINFWNIFVGTADFSEISSENYDNLCLLIQKLDKLFPGISEILWSNINGRSSITKMKGDEFYLMISSKIQFFENEIVNFTEKSEYLKANFSLEMTVQNKLADSKCLHLLVEFFTDSLIDAMDAISENDIKTQESDACNSIIDDCLEFIDTFLMEHATDRLITSWYDKFEYIPVRLFAVLNDLWLLGTGGALKSKTSMIWKNITKLVGNNLNFARSFMTILTSKTRIYRFPAFSGKIVTPKCLIETGESDRLNFDFLFQIIDIGRGGIILNDYFFSCLSQKLSNHELTFNSANSLLLEILSDSSIRFEMSGEGYATFWNPQLVISAMSENSVEFFKNYLKLIRTNCVSGPFTITPELFKSISIFIGFDQSIFGYTIEISREANLGNLGNSGESHPQSGFDTENLSKMVLSIGANSEKLQELSLYLFDAFYWIIVDGLSIKTIKRIFEKLVVIAKVFTSEEHTECQDFVFAYNSLLFSILRIPAFTIPDEAKSILILYEFYSKCFNFVPEAYENLIRVSKNSTTLVSLFTKIIDEEDYLPACAFDSSVLRDKKAISKIQGNYVRFILSNEEHMTQSCMAPIVKWIKSGKFDVDVFYLLMTGIRTGLNFVCAFNYIPLIAEFVNSPQFSDGQKLRVLEIAFSDKNGSFFISMCNRRPSMVHETFLEIFLRVPVSRTFLERFKTASWYEGFSIELERLELQKIENPTRKSSNLSVRNAAYLRDFMEIIRSGSPDYVKRSEMIKESEKFIEANSLILPLLIEEDSQCDPLRNCYTTLVSWNWEIADGSNCFFRVYGKSESFLDLITAHISMFMKTLRRKNQFVTILESIKAFDTQLAVLKAIPLLISVNNFVLNEMALIVLSKWFEEELINMTELTFEVFLSSLVSSVFGKVFDCVTLTAPVLDQMFSTFTIILRSKSDKISYKIHDEVLTALLELQKSRLSVFIEDSKCLMDYLHGLVEAFPSNLSLFRKLMTLLREYPIFYVKNRICWVTIWRKLSELMPSEFIESNYLKLLSTFGSEKFTEWKVLIPFLSNFVSVSNDPLPVTSVLSDVISASSDVTSASSDIPSVPSNPSEILSDIPSDPSDFTLIPSPSISAEKPHSAILSVILAAVIELISLSQIWDAEILLLLPEKLQISNFDYFQQIEQLLSKIAPSITKIAEELNDENSSKELSPKILDKIFLLIDFEARIKKTREWNWRSLFSLVYGCSKYEKYFIKLLLEKYPKIIESTTNETSILAFIYELTKFDAVDFEESFCILMEKSVGIYDKFSKSLACENLGETEISKFILISNFDDLQVVFENVKEFKAILDGNGRPFEGRQDKYAQVGLFYMFEFTVKLYNSKPEKGPGLHEICDLIVENISILLSEGKNLISLSKIIDETKLEAFIVCIGEHVDRNIEKYSIIISFLMGFADEDVADQFYLQIQDESFRMDVCLISEEIIDKYDYVSTNSFKSVLETDWPLYYISGLISSGTSIDPMHYKIIEHLLKQIDDDKLNYIEIFKTLGLLMERESEIVPVLSLLERILNKENEKDLYRHFLTDKILTLIFNCKKERKRYISFLKTLQRANEKAYFSWNQDLLPETLDLLSKNLQDENDSIIASIHTKIALTLILKMEMADFTFNNPEEIFALKTAYQNIEIRLVEPAVCLKLGTIFVDKLSLIPNFDDSWIEGLKSSVSFLLNFTCFAPETLEKFILLAAKVFSEEIFVNLAGRCSGREAFRTFLEIFKTKIHAGNLKAIKSKLSQFGLADDQEVLLATARNSEPNQLIEYLQAMKTISLERKLELFSVCKIVTSIDKVSKLINYYKSALTNNLEKAPFVIKAILENGSLLSCFVNNQSQSKTNHKNKSALLGMLQSQLNRRKAIVLVDEISNPVGRLIINLYYRPSSTKGSFITAGDNLQYFDFFLNFLALINENTNSKNKTSVYLKAFRLYEEIEKIVVLAAEDSSSDPQNILLVMTDGLAFSIQQESSTFVPSPESVYAVFKLTRRLISKKKERNIIMRRLLFPHPRRDCFEGFLRAQKDSISIDWELHNEFKSKIEHSSSVKALLLDFEAEFKA